MDSPLSDCSEANENAAGFPDRESLLSLDPMNGSHVALYGCGQTTRESLRI